MRDLEPVSIRLGRTRVEGRRNIGFYEGPYSRTAQIAVPDDWNVFAYADYDSPEAEKEFNERERAIYCFSVSPDGKELIAYKWRVSERHEPVHLKGAKAKKLGEDLNVVDPAELAEKVKAQFKG